MEKTNVLDGNELIAEFMGGKFSISKEGFKYCELPSNLENIINDSSLGSSWISLNFKFHKSWDWLIPVVEKIEKLMNYWDKPNYENGYTYWIDMFRFAFWDIECLYKSVIEFIKWYNENK